MFRSEQVLSGVGVITGLASTSMGGATLPIEATRIHTLNRGFKLTGKLGDVMKESAEIAYSFVTSNLKTFKGDPQFFDQAFVHLHVPEGATPATAPAPASPWPAHCCRWHATSRRRRSGHDRRADADRPRIADRRGTRRSPRGGRSFELILPEANRGDFDELPDYLKEGLTVHFAGASPMWPRCSSVETACAGRTVRLHSRPALAAPLTRLQPDAFGLSFRFHSDWCRSCLSTSLACCYPPASPC